MTSSAAFGIVLLFAKHDWRCPMRKGFRSYNNVCCFDYGLSVICISLCLLALVSILIAGNFASSPSSTMWSSVSSFVDGTLWFRIDRCSARRAVMSLIMLFYGPIMFFILFSSDDIYICFFQ